MRIQLSQAFRAMSGRHKVRSENSISSAVKATKVCHMEPLEERKLLSTYYVSSSGSDSASGASTSAAWKTISRVNSQKLKAGDKVLFRGGDSFSGGLYNPSTEAGSLSNPITFSTYGSG